MEGTTVHIYKVHHNGDDVLHAVQVVEQRIINDKLKKGVRLANDIPALGKTKLDTYARQTKARMGSRSGNLLAD